MEQAAGRADGRLGSKRSATAPDGAASERLFVVRVSERCCERLSGRGGTDYESPPQRLEAARALVALLVGRNHLDQIDSGELRVPVAGGSRTITLEAAP